MSIIKKTKEFILDTLFPINCLGCGRDHFWFCADCQKSIELLSFQKCPACEKIITENGRTCPKCKSHSHLDGLLVATRYKESHISKLIHLYKYRFIEDLHIPLGNILVKTILQSKMPLPDLIVPVPLHSRRLRWRGFNQSWHLSNYIGKNLTAGFEIPIQEHVLLRKKYTAPQMKVKKYSQRMTNLAQAFATNNISSDLLKGKSILLVDDIATTGATLFECAKVLKTAGAKKVFAVVIARQEI